MRRRPTSLCLCSSRCLSRASCLAWPAWAHCCRRMFSLYLSPCAKASAILLVLLPNQGACTLHLHPAGTAAPSWPGLAVWFPFTKPQWVFISFTRNNQTIKYIRFTINDSSDILCCFIYKRFCHTWEAMVCRSLARETVVALVEAKRISSAETVLWGRKKWKRFFPNY